MSLKSLPILLPFLVTAPMAGCSLASTPEASDGPFYTLCCTSAFGADIAKILTPQGIVCLAAGGDFGGTDWVIQGPPETRFRARELVLEQVKRRGWEVSWPADSIMLMNEWDQIGFEKGPWIRLASVEHRVSPTETILSRLTSAGISALFLFGETSDFVFVKPADVSASTAILRKHADAAIQIHDPRTSMHVPPPFIAKERSTSLTLLISAADTGRPLWDRVSDPMCFYRLPGGKHIVGYSMESEERPDGTLVASYTLPPVPSDVQGFVEYSFRFDLDGRSFWHGSPHEPFRVALK